jgi:hypothetical protein
LIGIVPKHDGLYLIKELDRGVYPKVFPLSYSLLVKALVIGTGALAPLTLLQVIFCVSMIVFSVVLLSQLGAPRVLILLLALFVSLSIPVGAYWTIAFRDVPAAFGLLGLAVLVFEARLKESIDWGLAKLFLYFVALLAAGVLRFGWELNLLFVPAALTYCAWPNLDRSILIKVWAAPLVILIGSQLVLPSAIKTSADKSHLTKLSVTLLVQPFVAVTSAKEGYSAPDKSRDKALLRSIFSDPGAVADAYEPIHIQPLMELYREEIKPGVPRRLLRRVIVLCFWNVALCASDRITMLLATLQPSPSHYSMVYYNLASEKRRHKLSDNRLQFRAVLIEYTTPFQTKLSYLAERLVGWSKSEFVKPFVWNAIPQVLLLVAGVLFYGRFPATAAACLALLLAPLLQSLVIAANDFRYVFAIYLGGLFVPPMFGAELIYRPQGRRGTGGMPLRN